jgi:Domain of unknown function DUF29
VTETPYEADFYAWLQTQAAHLRAKEWNGLDIDNLGEELDNWTPWDGVNAMRCGVICGPCCCICSSGPINLSGAVVAGDAESSWPGNT